MSENYSLKELNEWADKVIDCLSKWSDEVIKAFNGTPTSIKIEKLDFSEHDKAFENEIAGLKAKIAIKDMDYKTVSELLGKYQQENESLKQRIAELESKETETCEKEPISDDCRQSMEWYENRHQSDCIEINRLNTTIDVLIHKFEYLRQFAGLE